MNKQSLDNENFKWSFSIGRKEFIMTLFSTSYLNKSFKLKMRTSDKELQKCCQFFCLKLLVYKTSQEHYKCLNNKLVECLNLVFIERRFFSTWWAKICDLDIVHQTHG